MCKSKGTLFFDDLIDAVVRVCNIDQFEHIESAGKSLLTEGGFDIGEGHDGPIGASTTEWCVMIDCIM